MAYTQGIDIDGIHFNVPLVSVKRSFDFLDKYAERTEDGDIKRELIGVYANYTLTIGTIDDDNTYERLIDKLTEPVEFHDFTIPSTHRTYSFRGYVTGVSDEMEKIMTNTVKFSGLQCKYIAKKPFRVPER